MIIAHVVVKSAITPSFIGLDAIIDPGVRPSISRASSPTARILLSSIEYETTVGSFKTIPSPPTYTKVFAVPKSMPTFFLKNIFLLCLYCIILFYK